MCNLSSVFVFLEKTLQTGVTATLNQEANRNVNNELMCPNDSNTLQWVLGECNPPTTGRFLLMTPKVCVEVVFIKKLVCIVFRTDLYSPMFTAVCLHHCLHCDLSPG